MAKVRKTNVLVVFANPKGTDPLRLSSEERAIRESIKLSQNRNRINLVIRHATTIHDFRRELLDGNFQIVHISGHGTEKGLILENELGEPYLVPQDALGDKLKAHSPPIECVILNACYSIAQGEISAMGVPYTVAMEGAISDDAAIEFSRGFYDAVGAGQTWQFAYDEGCRTVRLAKPEAQFISKLIASEKPSHPALPGATLSGNGDNVIIEQQHTSSSNFVATYILPSKTYHRLVGRINELDSLMSVLSDFSRKPMVAVVGLGGIGKTALVREVTERCEQHHLFEHIVWTSFKTEHFIGEKIISVGTVHSGFDDLLNDIGRQCGQLEIVRLPLEQKQTKVKFLLATKHVLVVLDNLDTAIESDILIANFHNILGRSKLLVTSRHHIKHESIFTLNLSGFQEDEGVLFLRENSKERGIETVAQADRSKLAGIHLITGGAPLAMKLIIGQMSRQPMDTVLQTLKAANVKGQDYEFYRFIYEHSWELLDMNAQMVLVDMSVFPPVVGGASKDVQVVSSVAPNFFWQAIDLLVTLSLVDKSGRASEERFALHPLTQYFVRSDITKEWSSA